MMNRFFSSVKEEKNEKLNHVEDCLKLLEQRKLGILLLKEDAGGSDAAVISR
jgi:hypothetical protein